MSKTNFKRIAAAALAVMMLLSVVACGKPSAPADTYTYRTYTGVSPSNWNELTYQDENDKQIMSYIGSSFFTYDFKYDDAGNIVPGDFVIKYDAATKLEDTTAKYAEAWGLDAEATGYSYTITLRDDLKWDDGTPIKAEDFVYSMKEQLNPDFQNYRADSFYTGATVIRNAQNYVYQGQTFENIDNSAMGIYDISDLVKGDDGVYTQPDGNAIYFAMTTPLDYCSGKTVTQNSSYMDQTAFKALQGMADANGNVKVTDETIALWTTLISTEDWQEDASYLYNYLLIPSYTYPVTDFSEVGIFAASDYELVLILDLQLNLLKDDGSLSYQAAYNMSSLPLVHKDKFEANKVAPDEKNDLWTSKYNSSVETTASWGPYKLTAFQAGKQYVLERNTNWYGYALEENKGLYQTDKIICDTVKEWSSAWDMFLAGQIDGIGIDVSVADEYKGSDRAYFTPDDLVGSLQLQSNKEALKARESDGINKSILSYVDFRKALSLSIDRDAYTKACTTSSLAGFGLFKSMHYYDVENGGAYRNTDEAKKVLCEIYAVDYTKYESLDAAAAAITGYNLTEAKKLLTSAYEAALAAGDIKATDKVVLTFGTATVNESFMRHVNFMANSWKELAVGTPLEGKIEVDTAEHAANWANDFRAGAYDVCLGGFSGAAWDPGYFLLAYLSPAYMYSQAWNTSEVMMTFTMVGCGKDGEDITATMSLMDWYNCLNGKGAYNFSATALPQEKRLPLIAALEKQVLQVYYSVPVSYSFGASLISFKVAYVTYEYNTFMGYGGMKYMTYNFSDAEWAAEVAKLGGEIDYK